MSKSKTSIAISDEVISALVFSYYIIFGVLACQILHDRAFAFVILSMFFAAFVILLRSIKFLSNIFNVAGEILMWVYIVVFGLSSYVVLRGSDLLFFATSYIFAISIIYIKDPARIRKS
jgi:hypothetical protein